MNLKSKFKYISGLLFFQVILDIIFTIIIKSNNKEDCLYLSIYLIIDTVLKLIFNTYPLYILSHGLQIQKFYILGSLVETGIYIFNLVYPIILVINYSLPVHNGEQCQNVGSFLIVGTIVAIGCNVSYCFLFKNTLKNDYQLVRECVVCLETINNQELRLKCGHHFHRECILEWGVKRPNCPICRGEFSIFIN